MFSLLLQVTSLNMRLPEVDLGIGSLPPVNHGRLTLSDLSDYFSQVGAAHGGRGASCSHQITDTKQLPTQPGVNGWLSADRLSSVRPLPNRRLQQIVDKYSEAQKDSQHSGSQGSTVDRLSNWAGFSNGQASSVLTHTHKDTFEEGDHQKILETSAESPPFFIQQHMGDSPLMFSKSPDAQSSLRVAHTITRRTQRGYGRTASSSSNIMTDPLGAGHASTVKTQLRKLKSLYPQQSPGGPSLSRNVWTLKEAEAVRKRHSTKKSPIKKVTMGSRSLSNPIPKESIQDSNLALLYEKGVFHEHMLNIRASIERAARSSGSSSEVLGGVPYNPPPSAATSTNSSVEEIRFIQGREHHQWSNPLSSSPKGVHSLSHVTPLLMPGPGGGVGPQEGRQGWRKAPLPTGGHLPQVVGHGSQQVPTSDTLQASGENQASSNGSQSLQGVPTKKQHISDKSAPKKTIPLQRSRSLTRHDMRQCQTMSYNTNHSKPGLFRDASFSFDSDDGDRTLVSYITPGLKHFTLDPGVSYVDKDSQVLTYPKFPAGFRKSTWIDKQKAFNPQLLRANTIAAQFGPNITQHSILDVDSFDQNTEDYVDFVVPPCSPQSSIGEVDQSPPKPSYSTFDGALLQRSNFRKRPSKGNI